MCIFVSLSIYIYVYMYVYVYLYLCIYVYIMYMCIYVCMYVYICIYVYVYDMYILNWQQMVRWHHQLNGHEFEHILEDGEEQGSLWPWGHKQSDMTEWLNSNE